MRLLILCGALAAALTIDASTGARAGAWCAWYDWSTYNCGFRTYQQCLMTISGAGGICRPNTFEPQRSVEPSDSRERRRHRSSGAHAQRLTIAVAVLLFRIGRGQPSAPDYSREAFLGK